MPASSTAFDGARTSAGPEADVCEPVRQLKSAAAVAEVVVVVVVVVVTVDMGLVDVDKAVSECAATGRRKEERYWGRQTMPRARTV